LEEDPPVGGSGGSQLEVVEASADEILNIESNLDVKFEIWGASLQVKTSK